MVYSFLLIKKNLVKKKIEFNLKRRDQEKKKIILTNEQDEIFLRIKNSLTIFNYHLIFGVTGSGKTMVYLQIANEVLNKNRQVLILLPEIVLVVQIYQIIKHFFYEDDVVIFHGKLGEKKKEVAKLKVRRLRRLIVLGTRSAFFLPFSDLGVIILDEEHDSSYKNNHTPRYHLKTIAHYYAQKKKHSFYHFISYSHHRKPLLRPKKEN